MVQTLGSKNERKFRRHRGSAFVSWGGLREQIEKNAPLPCDISYDKEGRANLGRFVKGTLSFIEDTGGLRFFHEALPEEGLFVPKQHLDERPVEFFVHVYIGGRKCGRK